MNDNTKLTREQVVFLTLMGVIGNIVYIHTWIDNNTDRAAWIASLVGILLIIPFLIWIIYLGQFRPGETIFDMIQSVFGKFFNCIICIIFFLINITVAVTHLNMFTEMINVFFLQYTPPWVIMAFIVFMGVLFVNGKIKNFARLVEILGVLGALNYFITFVFVFPKNFHTEYFIPIFDTSILGVLKGTLFITGGASECLLLFMIIVGFMPDRGRRYRWVINGTILSSIIFSFAIFIIIAMMSPELAKRIAFGGVNAARLIQVGEFVQGLEIFIFGTYQFIAIGKITMCMYCASTCMNKMFNNKKPLIILIITSLLIFIPSVLISSYNTAYFVGVILAKYIILPFSVLILLLASLSVIIKKKRTGSTQK